MVKVRLLWKLLAVHLLVLGVVVTAVWLSFDYQAADYFMTLIKKYKVEPTEVNEMFLSASHRTLIQVSIVAIAVATLLNYWLTRRILGPLYRMIDTTKRIAEGDYSCRVRAGSGDELGMLSSSFDSMASSLERMEKMRKNMVIDVAHELRTPLTNIRGYIEALQDGLIEPTEEVLGTLHGELLRLVRLTEDLLLAARQDAKSLRLRAADPAQLLDETLDLFRPRLQRRRVEVRTELEAARGSILVDPDQMKQVFSNLLQNCLQFTPEGGWVEIAARRNDWALRFTFSNPGEGIDAEELPWIFEHYHRVDKSRSRDAGGAGIGLAIVKSLVEAHGGKVGAESDPAATRVWVELPARRPAGASLPKP